MLSGRVSLELTVDQQGAVTKSILRDPVHPLLEEGARTCVGKWKFQSAKGERTVSVILYYGFSGETREIEPRTVVNADFENTGIRVFITTDPPPSTDHP
jgi:hypothetical protein